MANIIKKINNNDILPSVEYSSISINNMLDDAGNFIDDRLVIDVGLRFTPRNTSFDNIVLDKEYIKYIKTFFILTQNEEEQTLIETLSKDTSFNIFKNQLISSNFDLFNQIDVVETPINNYLQVEKQFDFYINKQLNVPRTINEDTNTIKLNTFVFFDVESYFSDNGLSSNFIETFSVSLGVQEVLVYPITDKNSVPTILLVENSDIPVETIVTDFRSIQYFTNKSILAPSIETVLKKSYLNIFVGNDFETSLKNFIIFEYRKFLVDKSYIDDQVYNNFSILIEIYRKNNNSYETSLIDTINLFKDSTTRAPKISSYLGASRLVSLEGTSALIYFEDKVLESISSTDFYYEVQVKYVDNTFFNIYEPYKRTGEYYFVSNQYEQIKNFIYLANKNSYSKTIVDYEYSKDQKPKPTIFYLNTDTDKFTQQFIEYYNKQSFVDDSTGVQQQRGLNIQEFITNFALLLNKFLPQTSEQNQKISSSQVNQVVKSLDLSKATYKNYLNLFKSIDPIMKNLEFIFSSSKQNVSTYVKLSKLESVSKENTYFKLTDFEENKNIPTVTKEKILELFVASKKQIVLPKYFVDLNNDKIDNLLLQDFDVGLESLDISLLNRISNKVVAKKQATNESIFDNNQLLSELGVSIEEYTEPTILKRELRKPFNFSSRDSDSVFTFKDLSFKTVKNKNQRLIVDQFYQNDPSLLKNMESKNNFINEILFTTVVPDVKYDNKFISPSIKLKFFDFNDKIWKPLEDDLVKRLRNTRLLIEASITTEGYTNIFDLSKVDTDLQTRYFIMES